MKRTHAGWCTLVATALLAVTACGSEAPISAPSATSSTASSTSLSATAPSTSRETSRPETSRPETMVTAPPLSVESSSGSIPEPAPEPTVTTEAPVVTESEPAPTTTSSTPSSTATTSTPPPAPAAPTGDGAGKVVVLDPGHNGRNGRNPSIINAPVDAGFGQTKPCNTTGTETNDGYPEHEFTWAVVTNVKGLLEQAGVEVILTRQDNDGVGPCVNERAAVGNDHQADAVVSVHGDGSAAGDRGFYAMTAEREPNGADTAAQSDALAAAVRDALVENGLATSNYVGSDGMWKRDDLGGLNLSLVPTTMIEMGNMRDAQDAALMKSDAGQDEMAAGIAQGILNFLG